MDAAAAARTQLERAKPCRDRLCAALYGTESKLGIGFIDYRNFECDRWALLLFWDASRTGCNRFGNRSIGANKK